MTGEATAAPTTADLAVALLTYNNAATVGAVADAAADGIARHFPAMSAVLVNADAGSSDGTTDVLMQTARLPVIVRRYEPPAGERVVVPFHGVPGRGNALRAALATAGTLQARALVVLEADAASLGPEWIRELATPILEGKADLVCPAYARHRWEGTITRLLLSPLVRALYGRRMQQPLGGQIALSARLVEHLLIHPKWDWAGRDVSDLWITGSAIADGFTIWEALLGQHRVRSRTRTADLPAMLAETLGTVFALMDRHQDLWLEVHGSEPLPTVGVVAPAAPPPPPPDIAPMLEAFRQGVRDLGSIWEIILAPDTLGEVLVLDTARAEDFRLPDELWVRVVYDFALGHHYGVVHRDHLLGSLVPLYLGRTAAYIQQTRHATAEEAARTLEEVGAAFERQKPYLVQHWR